MKKPNKHYAKDVRSMTGEEKNHVINIYQMCQSFPEVKKYIRYTKLEDFVNIILKK